MPGALAVDPPDRSEADGAGLEPDPEAGGVVLMHSYRCSSCGASAYSAANPSTVGLCPRCSGPLRLESEQRGRDAARTAAWSHLSDAVAARRTVAVDDATRSTVGRLSRRHPSGGV